MNTAQAISPYQLQTENCYIDRHQAQADEMHRPSLEYNPSPPIHMQLSKGQAPTWSHQPQSGAQISLCIDWTGLKYPSIIAIIRSPHIQQQLSQWDNGQLSDSQITHSLNLAFTYQANLDLSDIVETEQARLEEEEDEENDATLENLLQNIEDHILDNIDRLVPQHLEHIGWSPEHTLQLAHETLASPAEGDSLYIQAMLKAHGHCSNQQLHESLKTDRLLKACLNRCPNHNDLQQALELAHETLQPYLGKHIATQTYQAIAHIHLSQALHNTSDPVSQSHQLQHLQNGWARLDTETKLITLARRHSQGQAHIDTDPANTYSVTTAEIKRAGLQGKNHALHIPSKNTIERVQALMDGQLKPGQVRAKLRNLLKTGLEKAITANS